jgi:hypothetical protein
MNRLSLNIALLVAFGFAPFHVPGQQSAQPPRPNADPYANNPDAGKLTFPLAAPAGKDSGAIKTALPGAVNVGPFDMNAWKYGTNFNPPAGSKIWNPVKLKMMQGGKVTGGTLFSSADPET